MLSEAESGSQIFLHRPLCCDIDRWNHSVPSSHDHAGYGSSRVSDLGSIRRRCQRRRRSRFFYHRHCKERTGFQQCGHLLRHIRMDAVHVCFHGTVIY